MTLDEAITHAREVAQRGGECAKDHEQLAEWLEELRKLKTIAATLGSNTKGCENLLWELVGALDVVDATDASKKPIIAEYARRIAATLGRHRAKSHPYGYERDTGAYDCTRCECGCINDISATYCNDCGGEIEIDESAEKEYYDGYGKRTVFAEKHDDGSLEFAGKRYITATLGRGTCEFTIEYDRDEVERRRKMYEENPLGLFPQDMPESAWTCSNCGQQFKCHYDRQTGKLLPVPDWMKCCPSCGKRIRKAVDA